MSDQEPAPDLNELAKRRADAERAWRALDRAGGLVTIGEIATRWGVEKQTVRNYAERRDDFPAPVTRRGRSDIWLTAAIDEWRATPRRPGRRPKNPQD